MLGSVMEIEAINYLFYSLGNRRNLYNVWWSYIFILFAWVDLV
jgi:hypothetical protein